MGCNTRTAPRLPCLVFHWAKRDVWYFMLLEKYILFLTGWCYSRYRNKEWLKLEGASGGQERLGGGSTLYLLSFHLWVWPGAACSSTQVSWHFFLLLYLTAWMKPSLTWMRQPFNKKQILGPSFLPRSQLLRLFWADLWGCCNLFSQNPSLWACFSPFFLLPGSWTPAKAAFDFQMPNKPLTVGAYELQQNSASCLEDFIISVIQEPPGLLLPVALSLQERTSQFTFSLN